MNDVVTICVCDDEPCLCAKVDAWIKGDREGEGGGMSSCYMHNSDESVPARYEMLLPIGNVVPLCGPCCAWWRLDARGRLDDAAVQPVAIWQHPGYAQCADPVKFERAVREGRARGAG